MCYEYEECLHQMCFYVVAIITCLCVDINHAVDTMHWCNYQTWTGGSRWSITNRLLSRHSSLIHPHIHCPRRTGHLLLPADILLKILLKLWTMWCDRVVIKIFSGRCKDNWCQHHFVSRHGDTRRWWRTGPSSTRSSWWRASSCSSSAASESSSTSSGTYTLSSQSSKPRILG